MEESGDGFWGTAFHLSRGLVSLTGQIEDCAGYKERSGTSAAQHSLRTGCRNDGLCKGQMYFRGRNALACSFLTWWKNSRGR